MEAPLAVTLSQSMDSVNTATGEEEVSPANPFPKFLIGKFSPNSTPINLVFHRAGGGVDPALGIA